MIKATDREISWDVGSTFTVCKMISKRIRDVFADRIGLQDNGHGQVFGFV